MVILLNPEFGHFELEISKSFFCIIFTNREPKCQKVTVGRDEVRTHASKVGVLRATYTYVDIAASQWDHYRIIA